MKALTIGSLGLKNGLITAPMAGITGRAFRDILRSQGAGLVYGEMISAQALCYGNRRTFELLALDGEAFPRGVQLCGGNPAVMAEAAAIVEGLGADIIDINMGCPAPKVVKNREGAYLMRHPQLAREIVSRTVQAVRVPVTVKMRSGWDEAELNCVELAKALEAAGSAAITVHGRHRQQFYSGQADWAQIKAVKKAVKIPVIGNGDIFTPAQALAMLKETDCDGIMPGRGLLGNPWLVKDILALLAGENPPGKPASEAIIAQAMAHLRHQAALEWGHRRDKAAPEAAQEAEWAAVRSMRGHLAWYIKGMPGCAAMRVRLNRLDTIAELAEAFRQWAEENQERAAAKSAALK